MNKNMEDVQLGWIDDEYAQIVRCCCGYEPKHDVLSIYPDESWECPKCGIKLCAKQVITPYEIKDK